MAIYHCSMKNGKKGKASLHARYITSSGQYENKSDVIEHAAYSIPDFADSGLAFFAAADREERKNGRSYKELELSLPNELSHEQRKLIINELVKKMGLENQPRIIAFHKSKNSNNPHCHLMFSERTNADFSADQFFKRNGSKKDRKFNDKSFLSDVRAEFAAIQNKHLKLNGYVSEVSHLSNKDRKINRIAQPKIGAKALSMRAKNLDCKELRDYDRIMKINVNREKQEKLDTLFKSLAKSMYPTLQKTFKELDDAKKTCRSVEPYNTQSLFDKIMNKTKTYSNEFIEKRDVFRTIEKDAKEFLKRSGLSTIDNAKKACSELVSDSKLTKDEYLEKCVRDIKTKEVAKSMRDYEISQSKINAVQDKYANAKHFPATIYEHNQDDDQSVDFSPS